MDIDRNSILGRIEEIPKGAARLHQLDKPFPIAPAILFTPMARTASGTERSIRILTKAVIMRRQVTEEVVLVPGNHHTNGVAAAMPVGQRFQSPENVEMVDLSERQYATYGENLILFTHGDLANKRMQKIGEVMQSEIRELYGQTEWSSVFVDHLYHKAMNMINKSGRVVYQAPLPIPIDSYHDREAYVGVRKVLRTRGAPAPNKLRGDHGKQLSSVLNRVLVFQRQPPSATDSSTD